MASKGITFGVEFEFALAALHSSQIDPGLPDSRKVRDLCREDIHVDDEARLDDVKESIAQVLNAAGLRSHTQNNDTGYLTWHVSQDISVLGPMYEEQYDWYGIEVKSPVYYLCADSLKAITFACQTLTSNFRIAADNNTCGLHVHVGYGDSGLSFKTLRNLMAFLWTFEPEIGSFHKDHRINSFWARQLRQASLLARSTRISVLSTSSSPSSPAEGKAKDSSNTFNSPKPSETAGLNYDDWCFEASPLFLPTIPTQPRWSGTEILFDVGETSSSASSYVPYESDSQKRYLNIDTVTALSKIISPDVKTINNIIDVVGGHPGDKMAYYLLHMEMPFSQSPKRTVEFRQHAGTLDAEAVVAWAETVTGLVELAEGCSIADLTELMLSQASLEENNGNNEAIAEKTTAIDLLNLVGLHGPAQYYAQRRLGGPKIEIAPLATTAHELNVRLSRFAVSGSWSSTRSLPTVRSDWNYWLQDTPPVRCQRFSQPYDLDYIAWRWRYDPATISDEPHSPQTRPLAAPTMRQDEFRLNGFRSKRSAAGLVDSPEVSPTFVPEPRFGNRRDETLMTRVKRRRVTD